jgi:DNA-directed RNA polymerase specialized sigma24 family protein
MKDTGSLSLLLEQLKAGEQAALQPLWDRSFGRLVDQAQQQLRGRPLGVADAEDVALSAFDSFHRGVGRGRFPRLQDRDDLWQVLLLLLRQKAINLLKHETRQKRGGGKVQHFSALPEGDSSSSGDLLAACPGAGHAPAVTAEAEEEFRHLLDVLGDDELRMIALCKMEGYSNEEIAGRLECSLATVERRLNLIRKIWSRRINERR